MITDWLDPVSYKLGQAAGGGGGGGNPNYVETITGTIGNPWGAHTFSDIKAALASNEITAYIVDDLLPGERIYLEASADGVSGFTGSFHISTQSSVIIVDREIEYVAYDSNGACVAFFSVMGTTSQNAMTVDDYTEDAADATCTLYLIHHPLP